MDKRPIGVFDSGLGGLTVLKELTKLMPNENYIFFGDTKRVPYGDKSMDEIHKFALEDSNFMRLKGVKLLVVACNTMSVNSLDLIREENKLPTIGVIKQAANMILNYPNVKKALVIATNFTSKNKSYEREIKAIRPDIEITSKPTPDLVPLIESGRAGSSEAKKTLKFYLEDEKDNIDCLILGCTHYPVLKDAISEILPSTLILNPSLALAKACKEFLHSEKMLNGEENDGKIEYYVSKNPEKFAKIGKTIMGRDLEGVKVADVEGKLASKDRKI